jgi:hypothetical protein
MNDEEQAIFNELTGASKDEKIKILTDSIAAEDDKNNCRVLYSFLSKLKGT